jgi:uncharacterized membrane protein
MTATAATNGEVTEFETRRSAAVEVAAVAAVVIAVAAYWATCSVLIHRSFHSNGWDLGLIDQVIWNSAHGRLFHYSFRDISFAGDHWEPFLLALVPLKWLGTGPDTLLAIQAVVLAAAAIPLYAASRAMAGRGAAGAIAAAYLLGLAPARAVSFDFHVEAFAPLFAFAALLALVHQRRMVFVVAALLILTLKEDGALLTLSLCWIGWVAFGERSWSAGVAAVAVVYALVATSLIIPHFRGGDLNPFVERYGYLGDSPVAVIAGCFRHPGLVWSQLTRREAIDGIALALAGTAFLPLMMPRLLPPLAIVTVLPLLSKEAPQGSLNLHYLLVPSTVALLIAGIAMRDRAWESGRFSVLTRALAWAAPAALVLVPMLLLAFRSPLPPSLATELDRFDVDHHAHVSAQFVRAVPPGAVVSAQSPFVPHLSERRKVYVFPRLLDAEYVLLDEYGPIPAEDIAGGYDVCRAALPRLGFDEIRAEDGISLWRKTRPAESVPEVPLSCSGQHPRAAGSEQHVAQVIPLGKMNALASRGGRGLPEVRRPPIP